MTRFILSLFFAASSVAMAAEPLSTSTDWREWYYSTNRTRWNAKPISELRAGAKAGHAVAKYALAKRLFKEGSEKYAEGDELIRQAAELGLAQAIYDQGLERRRDRADDLRGQFELFEKAATSGYPRAQVAMAQIIESGNLMRPDHERALQLLRSAADAGDDAGHWLLGLMYSVGVGEPREGNDTAIYHIRCAAQAGNTTAMDELAKRYRQGYTVPKDLLRAAAIFVEAASHPFGEFTDAAFRLEATEPDAEKFNAVVDLFVAALIRNDANAFPTLAEMHTQGDSGEINLPRAAALFDLASRNGNSAAAAKRDALLPKFTADEYKRFRGDVDWMTAVQKRRMER